MNGTAWSIHEDQKLLCKIQVLLRERIFFNNSFVSVIPDRELVSKGIATIANKVFSDTTYWKEHFYGLLPDRTKSSVYGRIQAYARYAKNDNYSMLNLKRAETDEEYQEIIFKMRNFMYLYWQNLKKEKPISKPSQNSVEPQSIQSSELRDYLRGFVMSTKITFGIFAGKSIAEIATFYPGYWAWMIREKVQIR